MKAIDSRRRIHRIVRGQCLCVRGKLLSACLLAPLLALPAFAIAAPPDQSTAGVVDVSRDLPGALKYKGMRVEQVQVVGNTQVSTNAILNLINTREGEPFDPATVVEDYQRIYRELKNLANVQPRLQPTATGVIITFAVQEQKQIRTIGFKGNRNISTEDLESAASLKAGEAIDPFRVNLAKTQIEKLYHDRNFPFAHADISGEDLARGGDLIFQVVEGPQVRIRSIGFIGNTTFSAWNLKDQIKSAYYIPIFRSGAFDPETVDEDVASLRKYYQNKGFFDAKVGRKLTFSGDQTDMQVTFIIDEGPRYKIDHLQFNGLKVVNEAQIRNGLKLLEGQYFDQDVVDRDVRQMVRTYSPFGLIYEPPGIGAPTPDYLHIDSHERFKVTPGHIDLVYDISEGRPFRIGPIYVKGNAKTQEKVVTRELRFNPGEKYDSSEVADAIDRLRGTPYFSAVTITPIPTDDPDVRAVVVEVAEQRTASINVGIGINSNGGVGGDLTYEQKNFDITNIPASLGDITGERAFTGAGQDFRASFQPGTVATNATISFSEPYLLDQPYSFGSELYLRNREYEHYVDRRLGGDISFGKRFNYVYSASLTLRAEDIAIRSVRNKYIQDEEGNDLVGPTGQFLPNRAPEIIAGQGHHTLTSATIEFARDTTNHGPVPYKGDLAVVAFSKVGAMGGTVDYNRVTFSVDNYQEISEDLLDRRTVLVSHLAFGDDLSKAPFYERFYGGGIGSIRGFAYRGVEPRDGPHHDPVGGDFSLTGGLELGFPLIEDILRGVVFTDEGDVERNVRFGTMRASIGTGFRLTLPFLGNVPLAVDFAVPLVSDKRDTRQLISFSLGLSR